LENADIKGLFDQIENSKLKNKGLYKKHHDYQDPKILVSQRIKQEKIAFKILPPT